MKRELEAILERCREQGCRVEKGNSSHWKVFPPNAALITVSSTPSDFRALHKIRSQLRRAGIEIPHKGGV